MSTAICDLCPDLVRHALADQQQADVIPCDISNPDDVEFDEFLAKAHESRARVCFSLFGGEPFIQKLE